MESKQFVHIHNDRIAKLDEEWANNSYKPEYSMYIREKDIGLVFIRSSSNVCCFEVVDTKKYMLAKIKYGI